MNCYEMLIELAKQDYNKIYINLVTKTLKIGRQIIIDNGYVLQHKINAGDDSYEFDALIETELDINALYEQYKTSLPSERDCVKHYFKALSTNELTDAQLITGMPRLEARIRLEAYILLASMKGILTWDNPQHWFWQGVDKGFIILKKYI